MRLAMSILVRDEADIIEANIRHHANLGVNRFIVTDNGSVDGTREILGRLSQEINLTVIDEPAKTIDQDMWVTRMANMLQQEDSADWVINNDADEFWLPDQGSLKEAILRALEAADEDADKIGMLYCQRHNLLPSQEAVKQVGYQFRYNRYRVMRDWTEAAEVLGINPATEDTAALYDGGKHIMIRKLPGKVITRLDGLESVDMGNHGAKHALPKVNTDFIEIAHYPIRDFAQFEKKVVNYGSSLENNKRFSATTSRHLRHWYRRHNTGELQREYDMIVLPETILRPLVDQGILSMGEAGQG